jgi:branched-subunit amino acid ABC-type transport system permease component
LILWDLTINGLVSGSLYAFLAIGFSLIYSSSHVFHIAHGAVYTFAAYVFYLSLKVLGIPFVVAVAAALAAAVAGGVLIELVVYRPIRRKGGTTSTTLVASLGVVSLLQAIYAIVFGTDTLIVNSGALATIEIGSRSITVQNIAVIVTLAVMFGGLQAFLRFTRWGGAIRALSDDPQLCQAHGLDADRLYTIVFAIGSLFAGAGAVLVSYDLGVRPEMGFTTIFIAVVALTVGGIGSLGGAVIGGLLLGLTQQLATWKIDSAWQNGIVFATLFIFLLLRPQGLFGARVAVRRA